MNPLSFPFHTRRYFLFSSVLQFTSFLIISHSGCFFHLLVYQHLDHNSQDDQHKTQN